MEKTLKLLITADRLPITADGNQRKSAKISENQR